MDANESIMRTVVVVDRELPPTSVFSKTSHSGEHRFRHRSAITNWLLALILFSLLVAGIVWAGQWFLNTEQLGVAKVRIEGELKHTTATALQSTIAKQVLKNFFIVDLDQIRDNIETLPWIAESHIRRLWPLTLVVWLREREALARWGEHSLVSPEGVVFTPDPHTIPSQLITLSGPEGSANQVINVYQWLNKHFSDKGLTIDKLALSERHAWYIDLASGLHLSVGTQNLTQRIERFLQYISRLPQPEAIEQVDLRYANGFAVRWRASVVTAP